jgi:hypothetical protein
MIILHLKIISIFIGYILKKHKSDNEEKNYI